MTNDKENELKTTQSTTLPKETEPKSESSSKLTGLALIVAAIAIALTLYNTQVDRRLNEQLLQENKLMISELKQLKHHQSNVQEYLQSKTNAAQKALNEKITDLKHTLDQAIKQSFYQNQDWLLLKTRYYLELAQINAHWSQDEATSIALLQQADRLLGQINTPAVYNLRQIVAKNIAQLQTLPNVDKAGLLSRLDALKERISAINSPIQTASPPLSDSNQTKTKASWTTEIQNNLDLLKKLIVVRRVDDPFDPFMSPLYKSLLIGSIQFNLQEAQWAVLNKNTQIYQFAIKKAIKQVRSVFKADSIETTALIKQLKELQTIQLVYEQPPLEEPLSLINQLIHTNGSTMSLKNSNQGVRP